MYTCNVNNRKLLVITVIMIAFLVLATCKFSERPLVKQNMLVTRILACSGNSGSAASFAV